MPSNETFKEAFLHYVWQYQYFDKSHLTTTQGESIEVLSPGFLNKNAGPDFYNCRLLLQGLEWHGTVEVHYKSSDWILHKHEENKAYNNVILHLVWEDDLTIRREDNSTIPTLVLNKRIDKELINKYKNLVQSDNWIPCNNALLSTEPLYVYSMLERCLVERLETKSEEILGLYQHGKQDWEATAYQWLGKCFGFKINSPGFERLTSLLPYSTLKKYAHSPTQMEALLMGVAGFLNEEQEGDYYRSLQKEFRYLAQKHTLCTIMDKSEWRFMRLRPANFPTMRIAQWSAFLGSLPSLFDFVFGKTSSVKTWTQHFRAQPHAFWQQHFHFAKNTQKQGDAKMGTSSSENLLLNGLVPLRFAYAQLRDDGELKESCIELLKELKAEQNHLLSPFLQKGIAMANAFDSQAYLQLYNHYCQPKQCLSCTIGHHYLHPRTDL